MQFVDEAIIKIQAGKGGDGSAAFLREKYRPRGGPSGGDGGHGGNVVLIANHNLSTLLDFKYKKHYKSQSGENGRSKEQHGACAEPLRLQVPVGTLVYNDDTNEELFDFTENAQELIVAKGGRGGFGNLRFVTATRQAPDYANKGTEGENITIRLELKLLADVGVIGFPNVGKSTFISKVSKARPKIADYPFTTLTPNLGVVAPSNRNPFVKADVPGLIPDAHKGTGLGIRFLRHVERTRVFLHMLEFAENPERDPIHDYEAIQNELKLYDQQNGSSLAQTPTVVALNKIEDPELAEICNIEYREYFTKKKIPFFTISAISGENLTPLLHTLADLIDQKYEELEEKPDLNDGWNPL